MGSLSSTEGKALLGALAFALGVLGANAVPLSAREHGVLNATARDRNVARPPGRRPPEEIRRALQTIARAEESYRARRRALGVEERYASFHELVSGGLLPQDLVGGKVGDVSLKVTESPGIPGPIWVATAGRWLTHEQGGLFWNPQD